MGEGRRRTVSCWTSWTPPPSLAFNSPPLPRFHPHSLNPTPPPPYRPRANLAPRWKLLRPRPRRLQSR